MSHNKQRQKIILLLLLLLLLFLGILKTWTKAKGG